MGEQMEGITHNFCESSGLQKPYLSQQLGCNAVNFYVVAMKDKPWVNAREVYRALEYEKAARRFIRNPCGSENISHKDRWLYRRQVQPLIGLGIHKNLMCTSIRKGCIRWYFPLNSQTSEDTSTDLSRHFCYVLFPHV